MFAIIETGGKQYKVTEGQILEVEKLDRVVGEKIEFDVLLLSKEDSVITGTPKVSGSKVTAEIVEHGKGNKIVVFKYKPKKNVHKKQGHRQPYTKIKITEIK